MTPQEFEKLLIDDDPMKLADAVAEMDESQRRKFSKATSDLLTDIRRYENNQWREKPYKTPVLDRVKEEYGKLPLHNCAVIIGVLAVCPISQTKKVDSRFREDKFEAVALKVLCDRRPDWIDQWIELKMQGEWIELQWDFLRHLIKEGVCSKPTSDNYYRLMVGGMNNFHEDSPPLSQRLLQDPELLEEIYQLFKVETFAFNFEEGYYSKQKDNYETWTQAIVKLAASGHLDRQRLLDGCLRGLTSGFKNNSLTGYKRLFERLEPTAEELVERQKTFLDLLSSQVSHLATFALKMLKKIQKNKQLDAEAFLSAAPAVFDAGGKSQAKTVLTMSRNIAKKQPEMVPWAVNVSIEGLNHESADIQQQAVELLQGWSDRLHGDHVAILRDRLDDLAATVRGQTQTLLKQLGGGESNEETGDVLPEVDPAELRDRAEQIDPRWRKLAGVDEAIAAMEQGAFPAPLEFCITEVPVLSGLESITPIESLDELIDAVAHGLETVDSASEFDRILDGISRLCDQRPDDFISRTAPLLKRMEGLGNSDGVRGMVSPWGSLRETPALIEAWLIDNNIFGVDPQANRHEETNPEFSAEALKLLEEVGLPSDLTKLLGGNMYQPEQTLSIRTFLGMYLKELIGRVIDRQAAPLLSAATHQHGWIDPVVLAERILHYQENDYSIPKCDLILALLRLAPENRAAAFAVSEPISGTAGRAVRWALGGDEVPTRKDAIPITKSIQKTIGRVVSKVTGSKQKTQNDDSIDLGLWLAAGKARHPFGEIKELESLGIPKSLPDAIVPTNIEWKSTERVSGDYRFPRVKVSHSEEFKSIELLTWFPTVALHVRESQWAYFGVHNFWLLEYLSLVWPSDLDSFFIGGIHSVMSRIDDKTSTLDPNYTYLEPLFMADRPWSKMAYLLDWIGLVSKDSDVKTTALDVLIEAINDGRVHPKPMSEVLIKLCQGNWVKLNRLADSLREVSRLSELHAWFVAKTLLPLVESFEKTPRDGHHVLELLLETMTELELAPSAAHCERLAAVKGSSKLAKLSRSLAALKENAASVKRRRGSLQIVAARLERAERWAGSSLAD